MADTFEQILAQTSEPAPVQDTQTDTSTTESTQIDHTEDVPENVRNYLEQNPDHKPIADTLNKEFQRAFTGRLQEAAELRKMVEGVDPSAIQTLRQLTQLAQTSPEQVAQWYRSQADLLNPNNSSPVLTAPAGQASDPFAGIEPVTDAEALLLQHARDNHTWRQNFQQQQEQERLTAKGTQVKAERNALQTEFGVQIPDAELVHIWDKAERADLTIRQAYIALKGDSILAMMVQKAKDEASGVVQSKMLQGAGNPGGVAQRNSGSPIAKGNLHDLFREAMNQ